MSEPPCTHRIQSMTGSLSTPNWCAKCSLWFDDTEYTIVTIALPTVIDEPRGCPTPGACSCPSRDLAVNDTAEAIARWLDARDTTVEEAQAIGRTVPVWHGLPTLLAEGIRAGAWRGQNGGE